MAKYYDLKAVYNPFDEEFKLTVGSPVSNTPEEYLIPAKGIMLLPENVARLAVTSLSREVLRKAGKEVTDPSRLQIEEDLLSHEFEVRDLSAGSVNVEPPIKKVRRKKE